MANYPDLAGAVEDAVRAPSVHNTQPWRWRIRPDAVELHADWDRHLTVTDPERRDLVLSCGAALHHLLVALAARGMPAEVRRLPDPEDSTHLATVTIRPGASDELDADAAALYPAIAARRTDRRRLSRRAVPDELLRTLQEHATHSGALLVPVADPGVRDRLTALLTEAAQQQWAEPGYAAELRTWTNRLPGGHDGVPAGNVAAPPPGATAVSGLRRFGRTALAQPTLQPGVSPDDAAELLVLATTDDDVPARLRAGEAISAVLLAATLLGLATTPLSQALELASTRREMRTGVLHIPEHPQLVLRIGWPATGAGELPPTPRRPLSAVLLRD
jgi:nitroreductase